MPKTLSAIANLLRVRPLRRIPFLGLTGTGLDDYDGRMIAAALEDAPPRVSMEPERLDLTQIDFIRVIQARLLAAGEKAGVHVLLSIQDGCSTTRGMPKMLSAIAKLLRVRHIPFLGLTGTGLEDFDGRMIAAALEDAPPRVSMEPERLDLTQIDFVLVNHQPPLRL